MRKIKRGDDDITRSLHKDRRAKRGGDDLTRSLRDLHGVSIQDVLTELVDEVKSSLFKSVASLALRSGETLLFACSGIAIERKGYSTKFVTSASLAQAFYRENQKKGHGKVKIEVRHEGSEVYQGFLAQYDLDHNFSVVKVRSFLDVHVGLIKHAVGNLPDSKVVAIGRGTSGELMTTSVVLNGDLSRSDNNEDPVSSRVKITKAWEGGPLFSFDGKFVGMNLFLVREGSFFLPWGTILSRVYNFWMPQENKEGLQPSRSLKGVRFGERPTDETLSCHLEAYRDVLNRKQFVDIDSMGYPKLPMAMLDAGLVLVNTFEAFGDVWGQGIWREFRKTHYISRSIVALASFNGEKMVFACTGFFIPWNGSTKILTSASLVRNPGDGNKIIENLRIKVLLANEPNKLHREGTLEHYSLHYNIALVSVKDTYSLRPANIQLDCSDFSRVAAVGRCFRTGTLMAAGGDLVSWSGRLDCKFVVRSSCKISKAGIGGPLVNLDGDIIGMNFYSKKIGTPFLLWKEIAKILEYFKGKSEAGEVSKDSNDSSLWRMDGDSRVRLNRWPVPMPYWQHPEKPRLRYAYDSDEYVSKDEPDFEIPAGEDWKYGYIRGMRVCRIYQSDRSQYPSVSISLLLELANTQGSSQIRACVVHKFFS